MAGKTASEQQRLLQAYAVPMAPLAPRRTKAAEIVLPFALVMPPGADATRQQRFRLCNCACQFPQRGQVHPVPILVRLGILSLGCL